MKWKEEKRAYFPKRWFDFICDDVRKIYLIINKKKDSAHKLHIERDTG